LPWNGRTEVEIQILDADEANAGITRRQSGTIGRGFIDLKLKAPAVALVRLFEEAEQRR
jgi:hypothetical protein